MAKGVLHILNGDSAFALFQQANIPGEVMIWRELLSEGPVNEDISKDSFWEKRQEYVESNFQGNSYKTYVMAEMEKLQHLNYFSEIVLWFEYDLFCHINFMACLQLIDHDRVSLICEGYDPIEKRLKGLGEISPRMFLHRYNNRRMLLPSERNHLTSVWKAYSGSDLEKLERLVYPRAPFLYLHEVLMAHLKRFPTKNGLNLIERKFLEFLQRDKFSRRKIVGRMLKWQKWYGFGDLQYFNILDSLSLFVDEKNDILEVNELGEEVLQGNTIHKQPEEYIGGVWRPDYFRTLFN